MHLDLVSSGQHCIYPNSPTLALSYVFMSSPLLAVEALKRGTGALLEGRSLKLRREATGSDHLLETLQQSYLGHLNLLPSAGLTMVRFKP